MARIPPAPPSCVDLLLVEQPVGPDVERRRDDRSPAFLCVRNRCDSRLLRKKRFFPRGRESVLIFLPRHELLLHHQFLKEDGVHSRGINRHVDAPRHFFLEPVEP
jgi:hypothetical protein